MNALTFWIDGKPATYATSREGAWKNEIRKQAPRPSLAGKEIGLRLRFILPTLEPGGYPLDVDNLCEPVFAILIGNLGWFEGRRTNVGWWQATKEQGRDSGCRISVYSVGEMTLPSSNPDYDAIYRGPFPTNARSPELADWARNVRNQNEVTWIPRQCSLSLSFSGHNLNISNISGYSLVKPVIDCLYPWLGGAPGTPDDHRIMRLSVSNSQSAYSQQSVAIKMWAYGRVKSTTRSARVQTAKRYPGHVQASDKSRALSGRVLVNNPCVPGTRKWIVCEGALANKELAQVQMDLERAHPGSGRRIKEYISDLRHENDLDIRSERERLVCHGYLK